MRGCISTRTCHYTKAPDVLLVCIQVSGYFTSENSRLYEVERRFGSFEAILKGDLEPYQTQEVKDALGALPRTYVENKQAYKDFFERYGPFFIDQVYNGGTIKATVVLSDGASVQAQNSASATYSGERVRASLGGWAVGFGSGGGGGDSSLTATIREQSSSEIQVRGGDHFTNFLEKHWAKRKQSYWDEFALKLDRALAELFFYFPQHFPLLPSLGNSGKCPSAIHTEGVSA